MANNRKTYITRTTERGNNQHQDIPLDMPYSFGLAVPRGGLMACLCADKNTYSRKCCKGFLINQGIGNIYGVEPVYNGSFSISFSSGFQGGYGTAK
jgi:hypothetical protein